MARILIAFDGSPSARAAIERSASLFEGAEAVVLSVALGRLDDLEDAASTTRLALPDDVIRRAVERLRESALADVRALADEGAGLANAAGLQARPAVSVTRGPLWEAVLDAARDAHADAVVSGTHGHGGISRAILGSVSSGLVRHADLPVVVVPQDAPPAKGPLVIGYDGSDPSTKAIEACGRLMPGRAATVVYVWKSRVRHTVAGAAMMRAPLEEVRGAVTELDAMFEQWAGEDAEKGAHLAREHGLDAQAVAIESSGAASNSLLGAADEKDACAIAVGRRGRGAVASAVLGSVSASLLHASGRPTIVV